MLRITTKSKDSLSMDAAHILGISWKHRITQESPANAKGKRDSSACMKAHCEQM